MNQIKGGISKQLAVELGEWVKKFREGRKDRLDGVEARRKVQDRAAALSLTLTTKLSRLRLLVLWVPNVHLCPYFFLFWFLFPLKRHSQI